MAAADATSESSLSGGRSEVTEGQAVRWGHSKCPEASDIERRGNRTGETSKFNLNSYLKAQRVKFSSS